MGVTNDYRKRLCSHCTYCLQTSTAPLSRDLPSAKMMPFLPAATPASLAYWPLPLSVFMHRYFFLSLFSMLTSPLCQKHSFAGEIRNVCCTAHFLVGAHWGQWHVWPQKKWVKLITRKVRHICLSRAEVLDWYCANQDLLAQVHWTWTVSNPWTEGALYDVLWELTKPCFCSTETMYHPLKLA